MTVIKSFFIAFSIYSKIPMPQFEWKEKDMEYSLCFFPWVGLVIGVLEYWWYRLSMLYDINAICICLVGAAIPLIISGGFHLDGFMDTMDALHSYQSRERKLEILKDSHVGAFAVIMLMLYYIIYIAAYAQVITVASGRGIELIAIFSLGFYMSRILSGIGVVTLKSAKKDGMLSTFATSAREIVVKVVLGIQFIICAGAMIYLQGIIGLGATGAALLTFIYYAWKSKKEFGGITGDVAGYFVTVCECVIAIVVAIGGTV